ncbi:MAG: DUF309 domain-containing protein [Chloroflexota bacterium]
MATPLPPSRRTRALAVKHITVPRNLRQACDEFNGGRFFECHETLEEIWQEEQGPVRDLYKGLIQVAAAFVHVTRNNFIGADRLLRTGQAYLAPYRALGAMGFDVARICAEAARAHAEVLRLGPRQLDRFAASLIPRFAVNEQRLAAESMRWGAWGFDAAGQAQEMEITVIE